MAGLLLSVGAVALITFLYRPLLGAGWWWDTGNALGLVGFGGLLYLMLTSSVAINLRAHQILGYAVLGIVTAHGAWFLIIDPVAIDYIKPGAPLYMWTGIGGLLLLGTLILIGLPQYRLKLHKRYAGFRYWHRALAIATVAGATWHIVGSGFYLQHWLQSLLFVGFVAALSLGGHRLPRFELIGARTTRRYFVVSIGIGAMFVGLRNIPL